jgi:hypothetical protein
VRVEYMAESDRKAWVRYVPPRWIYPDATICAVPSDVTRAMLRAWHANNGVLLGNPRLGFVCTKMTTDGQPGLEGYYYEADRPLEAEERLRFAPEEEAPDFDPARAPRLDSATWPPERLAKAMRNYAMTYVRTMLLALVETFGPDEARRLGGITGRLIGMQLYEKTAEALGVKDRTPDAFAEMLTRLGEAQGDATAWTRDADACVVRQTTWRLMGETATLSPAIFAAWNELWIGALSIHDRRARLLVEQGPGSPSRRSGRRTSGTTTAPASRPGAAARCRTTSPTTSRSPPRMRASCSASCAMGRRVPAPTRCTSSSWAPAADASPSSSSPRSKRWSGAQASPPFRSATS